VLIGIADHLGWAVSVTATTDHQVLDRRRIELVEAGVPPMPVHHGVEDLADDAARELVARVRSSALRATTAALAELADAVPAPETTIWLRTWPVDFPVEMEVLRRSPWEARADAVMYRQVLAEVAAARGWAVRTYEAKGVEERAAALLGEQADEVLRGPRRHLGAPWAKDHRVALAATIAQG
jgi:hypothetical protein